MKKIINTFLGSYLLLFITACGGKAKSTEVVQELPAVRIAKVQERLVEQVYEYTGTIEAEQKNNIAPSSPLRIERILVKVGDVVRKRQRLVLMDTSNYRQLKLQLDNERNEFERINKLYQIGGVSKSEWDAAKLALDVKQSAYANIEENTSLLCPISGVVSAKNYNNGDMYNGSTPILVVEKISPVKMVVNIPESLYANVEKGQSVKVKVDVYSDLSFEGIINVIYPTINPNTRTFSVEILIDNKDQKIRPGMFARAELNYGTVNRVVLPDLAIVKQVGSGDRYVYVYVNGVVLYNKVELGRRIGSEFEVLSGVDNNADVVVAGQSRLSHGATVDLF